MRLICCVCLAGTLRFKQPVVAFQRLSQLADEDTRGIEVTRKRQGRSARGRTDELAIQVLEEPMRSGVLR